jgi:glycosyltransferase involved in cell wall biosynthesis
MITIGLFINRLSYFNSHRIAHANYFERCGYNVVVFTYVDCKTDWSGSVINIPWDSGAPSLKDLEMLVFLRRLLLKNKVDLIHSFSPKTNMFVLLSFFRGPVIYSFNGLGFLARHPVLVQLYFFVFKLFKKNGDDIVVQNSDDKFLLSKFFKNNVHLVPGSGFEIPNVVTDFSQKMLIVVSRLLASKGIYELIQAAAELDILISDLQIVVLGGESEDNPENIELDYCKANATKNLLFLGRLEKTEVFQYYSKACGFLLPSYREGLSFAAIEAAAHGLPLLLSDVVGSREQVIEGYNGLKFEAKSSVEIVNCVLKFFSKDVDIRSMGFNSRLIFEQNWELNKVMNDFHDIYRNSFSK